MRKRKIAGRFMPTEGQKKEERNEMRMERNREERKEGDTKWTKGKEKKT